MDGHSRRYGSPLFRAKSLHSRWDRDRCTPGLAGVLDAFGFFREDTPCSSKANRRAIACPSLRLAPPASGAPAGAVSSGPGLFSQV